MACGDRRAGLWLRCRRGYRGDVCLPGWRQGDGGGEGQCLGGLKQALLAHPDRFVTTVTEKLLTYAIGRGVEYYDAPAVRAITREAAPDDYRLTTLILGVVKSTPFRMRSTQS